MKILHSADWHMDSPLVGRTAEQTALLRKQLLALPGKVMTAAKNEGCDLVLLSGDLFDGACSAESIAALKTALAETEIPVCIAPGNHDYVSPSSPWAVENWPANVHIFTKNAITSVAFPALNCRVYGAAFTGTDAPSLLDGFRADCTERYAVGVLHGDPTQKNSPYCPVSAEQVENSGLDYLALGHIHKGGEFRAGSTLCAWPGCPQGRGFDELGEKGVRIVTLEETAESRFLPLDTVRFYDLEAEVTTDPTAALAAVLPPVGSDDLYRVTLTGESNPIDLIALAEQFARFPNLELRDRTVPPLDIWGSAGDDTLEGVYFGLLHAAMENQDEKTAAWVHLAAKISRQILNGQEVKLP